MKILGPPFFLLLIAESFAEKLKERVHFIYLQSSLRGPLFFLKNGLGKNSSKRSMSGV